MFGLILVGPLILIIYVYVLFDEGSPIFPQERVGGDQQSFTMLKFKTMRPDTAAVAYPFGRGFSYHPLGFIFTTNQARRIATTLERSEGGYELSWPLALLVQPNRSDP